jgi:hypothetical protein
MKDRARTGSCIVRLGPTQQGEGEERIAARVHPAA